MSKVYRDKARANSNNDDNANKNVCALAVAKALGVDGLVRYLHNIDDIKRAAGMRYSVRSRRSALKGDTVGSLRSKCKAQGALCFIVWIQGHVLLLDSNGATAVDTDSRKNDRRKVRGVWGVFPK